MRDGTGQKNGGGGSEVIKERKKNSHFFIELILDHWISSKKGLYDTYETTQPTRRRP